MGNLSWRVTPETRDPFLQGYYALRSLTPAEQRALGLDPKDLSAKRDLESLWDADPMLRYEARPDETPISTKKMAAITKTARRFSQGV